MHGGIGGKNVVENSCRRPAQNVLEGKSPSEGFWESPPPLPMLILMCLLTACGYQARPQTQASARLPFQIPIQVTKALLEVG